MVDEMESLKQHAEGQGSYGAVQNSEETKPKEGKGNRATQAAGAEQAANASQVQDTWNWREEILYLTLFVSNVLTFMTFSLMGPLFPAEAKSKGVSYTVQGWIFSFYSITQVCTSYVHPWLAEISAPDGSKDIMSHLKDFPSDNSWVQDGSQVFMAWVQDGSL